jgi:putative DNA primase/helicase
MQSYETDIFKEAREKISSSLIRSMFYSDGAYERDGELWTVSPLRTDKQIGSFSINLSSGIYSDFACPDHKGDFIDLVAKSRNISLKEAAESIIGDKQAQLTNNSKATKENVTAEKKKPVPIIPIPEDQDTRAGLNKELKTFCASKKANPIAFYPYRDPNGALMFGVLRYEGLRGKAFSCVYLSSEGWIFRKPELEKYYPYGIERIRDNNLPILIVEGEKAGNCTVQGYNVISWVGGTVAVNKTYWEILADCNRDIIIWPDADSQKDSGGNVYLEKKSQPGIKAALSIRTKLANAHILDIYQYKPIETDPDGWDLADCISQGIDPLEVIEACKKKDDIEVEIDSYQIFQKFIEHFYSGNNLEQNGGVYWEYLNDMHYWRTAEKKDIQCNMQRWMEKTELHFIVSGKTKPTTFFNEMKQYLDTHSLGYIKENPFKDAAMMPYLHLKNGAVKVSKSGSEFISRDSRGEDFFKKLHPINCLDFDFSSDILENNDIENTAPCFNFFLEEVIPKGLKKSLSEEEYQNELAQTKMMFAQVLAYSLIPIKPNEYNFGLLGNQRAGKSFFVKLIKSLVGPEFCVERRIADMDSRFASADLWGKKVFIEPDMKTRQLLPEDFIKAYAGEQEITVERKNENPISGVKTSLALFFVSNYDFTVKGTEGVERRFIIINFKNKIDNPDTLLLDKILGKAVKGIESGSLSGQTFDERAGMLGFALQGWDQFIKDGFNFTIPQWAKEDKDRWMEESNSVSNFMYETYLHSGETQKIERTALYEEYKTWCEQEGSHPMGKKNCFSELRRLEGVTDMESARIFMIKGKYKDEVPF